MRKNLLRREWLGFFFLSLWGVAGHFLFQWSGENTFLGAIVSVNESTWEHMKLLFVPTLIFTMLEYVSFDKPPENFFAARFAAVLASLAVIPAVFYTLRGIFGETPDWVNISIFFLAAAVQRILGYRLLLSRRLGAKPLQAIAFFLFWAVFLLFVFFTFRPPLLPLFRVPLSGSYGIPRP